MNDDKHPEVAKHESWSTEDRRVLLITITGGLAANIGTVLIVGLALACVRWLRSGPPPRHIVVLSVAGICVIAGGLVVLPLLIKAGPLLRAEGRAGRATYWYVMALVAFVIFAALLVLVGDAAGVK